MDGRGVKGEESRKVGEAEGERWMGGRGEEELCCMLAPVQEEQFMHLTNYSVNKHSESFDRDESIDKGSKR